MNTFGERLRLTTFGESHGKAMGGILDGMPSGVEIDMEGIQEMIDRRRTGVDPLTSQRRETDVPEILSGVSEDGFTLGTPIGFIFRNSDARSGDYSELADHFRPNHADYCYDLRYGRRDYRGGGRASARETVNWVMGGALAREWLALYDFDVEARLTAVGHVHYDEPFEFGENAEIGIAYSDDVEAAMRAEVERARSEGDSVGGRVSCVITGVPGGLGDPVFGKVQARLAQAMMSLNAVKGFEYGMGSRMAEARGSEVIDNFNEGFCPTPFSSNHAGGVLGGITTGMPIYFNLRFKPTPTIGRPVAMATEDGEIDIVQARGRHDPCVAMRAPVIVEALSWMVLGDLMLQQQLVIS